MKTRLILTCVLIAGTLGGCVSDPPRVTGSLADKTYKEDIGKPKFPLLSTPDCDVR